jgi:phospholipase/lecithinase/hemolysin
MKFASLAALASLLPAVARSQNNSEPFKDGDITTFITFGDSTTDTVNVFNGGVQWPDYVMGYTGATLYPFAQSGSTCSNALTPRPFNALMEWQIPEYKAELANGTIHVDQSKTLYTIWMGTNDIGPNSIISASNNASVLDVANCLVGSVQTLYNAGARNFLFHNVSSKDISLCCPSKLMQCITAIPSRESSHLLVGSVPIVLLAP